MIITRTPLRISLFGGGTDFRDFYKNDYGAVLGFNIDKYVFVMVNTKFDGSVRAGYSLTENVDHTHMLRHDLIREGLLHMGIKKGIEVATMADVPSTGTGLGSSSSLLVGILAALTHYVGKPFDRNKVAELACDIEVNKLKHPIGKQDQYFATFGGLSYIRFNQDESVKVEKLDIHNNLVKELQNNILCFYTGIQRNAPEILSEQKNNIKSSYESLHKIRDLADTARDLLKNGDLTKFGEMLNHAWKLKKKLSSNVSNSIIDSYYDKAIESGALGGKINGAGGGGFLTLYCEIRNQERVRESLNELREMKINIEGSGSSLIFSDQKD